MSRLSQGLLGSALSLVLLGLLTPKQGLTHVVVADAAANSSSATVAGPDPEAAAPPSAAAAPSQSGAAPNPAVQVIGTPGSGGIVTVRPLQASATRQGLRQFVGISGANSGARALSLNEVIIPPGGRAQPHRHVGSESAIYVVAGTVRTYYGPCLEHSIENRAGDFLFIPAGVPHLPVNLSNSQSAIALVARDDPNEQERVELLDLSPAPLGASPVSCSTSVSP